MIFIYIGVTLSLIAIVLISSNKFPVLGCFLLIIGVFCGIKGRSKLDEKLK